MSDKGGAAAGIVNIVPAYLLNLFQRWITSGVAAREVLQAGGFRLADGVLDAGVLTVTQFQAGGLNGDHSSSGQIWGNAGCPRCRSGHRPPLADPGQKIAADPVQDPPRRRCRGDRAKQVGLIRRAARSLIDRPIRDRHGQISQNLTGHVDRQSLVGAEQHPIPRTNPPSSSLGRSAPYALYGPRTPEALTAVEEIG